MRPSTRDLILQYNSSKLAIRAFPHWNCFRRTLRCLSDFILPMAVSRPKGSTRNTRQVKYLFIHAFYFVTQLCLLWIDIVMNKLLFSENIQFEHLGAPIVLQAPPDPSKEDYFQSFGKGYSKSSFNSQLPSYWYNSENRLQPNYDSPRYKSQSTNSFSDPRFYHPSSFNFLNGKHKSFSQTFWK